VTKLTTLLGGGLVVMALCALGPASASEPQAVPDPTGMYEGLPAQEPNAVRLGVHDASDVQMQVSIRRKTMRCDDLEAHVEVLQAGDTRVESYACFGVERSEAITELVIGHGAGRHHYRIAFEYSSPSQTVAYVVRRVAGAGVIESQRVVVEVGRPS
jgi:hypothetical protein